MIEDKGYFLKVIKNISVFLVTLLIIFLSFKLAIFYIPFLIGFIISLLTEPMIRYISKKTSITRKTSAIIVLLCIFSILISLIIWGIIAFIAESSNFLQNINFYIEKIYNHIQNYLNNIDLSRIEISDQIISIIESSTNSILEFASNWTSSFLTSLLQAITSLPKIGIYTIITVLSTYFICTDKFYIIDQFEHHLPRKWVRKIGNHSNKIIETLGCYLKAEVTLVLISFIEVLIGLYILKWYGLNITYPLLAALGIGFVDALPILRFRNSYDSMGYNICSKWRY